MQCIGTYDFLAVTPRNVRFYKSTDIPVSRIRCVKYCAFHVLMQPNFWRYYFYFLPDQAQILLYHFNVLDKLWCRIWCFTLCLFFLNCFIPVLLERSCSCHSSSLTFLFLFLYCASHVLVQPNFRRYFFYFLPDQAHSPWSFQHFEWTPRRNFNWIWQQMKNFPIYPYC